MAADGLVEFAQWAGEQSYEQLPFCEVDAALWSQVAYLPLEAAFDGKNDPTLREAMAALGDLEAKPYELFLRRRLELARLMAEMPRFAEVVLAGFEDSFSLEDQMQFSALTAILPNGSLAVCYRGTDTTLVGWKEDFNLSYECPVPAQEAALNFAVDAAGRSVAPMVLLGHSKGGNLAVYAAANLPLDVQARVEAVYSFDGPGLMPEAAGTEGYQRVSGRIASLLPQGTLVGLLMHRHKPATVVKSRALGLFQHDLFSWEVQEGAPRFVTQEELSLVSQVMEENLGLWLAGLSGEERQVFSDAIFEVLTAADDKTLVDFIRPRRQRLTKMLEATRGVPPEVKSALLQSLGELISSTFTSFVQEAGQVISDLLPFGDDDEDKDNDKLEASRKDGDA